MQPRKITGQTVDPGDGSPLIDVDTAILALYEQLGREGARRAQNALGALINVASTEQLPWRIIEWPDNGDMGKQRERTIASVNHSTRVIALVPEDEEEADGSAAEPS